ncbi:MAG: asparaginase [Pseudonocardiales bacterium]|nr:MAG: asparaginase [Pseudonocardiales bacterium]
MPPEPLVLLEVTRSGFAESHHRGSLVLLDASGAVAVAAGLWERPVFPRSSLKPLQAVAMLECGFAGRDGSLALAAASHDGEDVHLAEARAILNAAGLDDAALQCPPELPSGREAMLAHVRAGRGPQRICHNCSGKHAAMLATCVVNGWDVSTYRDPAHPLQVAIRAAIEAASRETVAASGVDGCGAPAHAISLAGLARAFAATARAADGSPAALVRAAMRAHPRLLGGTGRAVTELTAGVDGLLCKDGAEAVWGAALPDGRAFAVKVEDGGARTLGPLLAAALRFWGVAGAAVRRWSTVDVLGGGAPVGTIGWSPALVDLLGL